MIADLIAIGVFSARGYSTPPVRTIILPGINVNLAPRPMPQLPSQYADAVIDYKIDWSALLLGDTILSGVIETIDGTAAPSRMVFNETTSSFFISGGASGFASLLKCEVSTPVRRTFEAMFSITTL